MSSVPEAMTSSSSAGRSRVFIYCSETAGKDALTYFKKKDYVSCPLSDKPAYFWELINIVAENGVLVILSHGDENGPLMVAGTSGKDMTKEEIQKFGEILKTKKIALYLLSCNTGSGSFFNNLKDTGATFVAPLGYADVRESSAGLSAYSTNGKKDFGITYLGWNGNGIDSPNRASKPLVIP